MVIYVLQNSILALLGSTIAAYKVLTVSGAQPNMREHPGPKSVIALMLFITNNGFRYFVSDFFLSKIFDEKLDVLGGESIGTAGNDEEHREPDRSHRMIPTPSPDSLEINA